MRNVALWLTAGSLMVVPAFSGMAQRGDAPGDSGGSVGFKTESGFTVDVEGGIWVHGALVIVTRSSGTFGDKDHDEPIVVDDFENYTAGMAPSGTLLKGAALIVDDFALDGDQSWHMAPPDLGSPRVEDLETDEIYLSYWQYAVEDQPEQEDLSGDPNLKTLSISSGNGSHTEYPSFQVGANGQQPGEFAWENYGGGGTNNPPQWPRGSGRNAWPSDRDFIRAEWVHHEAYFLLSTPGMQDGAMYGKVNGRNAGDAWEAPKAHIASFEGTFNRFSYQVAPQMTRDASFLSSRHIQGVLFPFFQRAYQRNEFWIDNLYVDTGTNAQARIDAAPAGGFGRDSRERRPQPYTSWEQDTITFTLNLGERGAAGVAFYFVSGAGTVEKIGQFD